MRAAGENYRKTFIHRAIREDTLQNKSQRPRTSEHCDRVAEWLRRGTENQYSLRAWVRIPSLSVLFHIEAAGKKHKKIFAKAIREDTLRINHTDIELIMIAAGWPID